MLLAACTFLFGALHTARRLTARRNELRLVLLAKQPHLDTATARRTCTAPAAPHPNRDTRRWHEAVDPCGVDGEDGGVVRSVTEPATTAVAACVGPSRISGRGLFANRSIPCLSTIGVALDTARWLSPFLHPAATYLSGMSGMGGMGGMGGVGGGTSVVAATTSSASSSSSSASCVTPLGNVVNHCNRANAKIVPALTSFLLGKYLLVATADIAEGEEITVDYYGAQWFILPPRPWWGC